MLTIRNLLGFSYGKREPEEQTYRLRSLESDRTFIRTPIYVLERTYSVGGQPMLHRVGATRSLVHHLLYDSLGRDLLQSVLHDLFWCLLDWRLRPEIAQAIAYIYIDPDSFRPRLAIAVYIPRDAALNWLDFWSDLEQRAYSHIAFGSVLIFVRRIDYAASTVP